jgi:cell division protein ZipA
MDNLRIILIILGIGIIAMIYIWERIQNKNNIEQYRAPFSEYDDDEPGLVITTTTKYDDDVSAELANLKNFMGEAEQDKLDHEFDVLLRDKLSSEPEDTSDNDNNGEKNDYANNNIGSDVSDIDTGSEELDGDPVSDITRTNEHLVVLYIVARDDNLILGNDLQQVANNLGFVFGAMNIYHYYDEHSSTEATSLFNLVNMFEPGYFDQENMAGFSTRGISVFANLSIDEKAISTFEAMLEIADKMATYLDCELLGSDKNPLNEETIHNIYRHLRE